MSLTGVGRTMPGPAFLEGDDVVLRTIERDDLAFCQEAMNDPRVRGGFDAHAPVTMDDEEGWYDDAVVDGDDVHLLACVDGKPVGTVGLNGVTDVYGVAELGYWIAPDHHGQGFATEAARLLVGYGFDERRLHRVGARAFEFNDASRRVLEKVGFEREGVSRDAAFVDGKYVDVYRFGLLEPEWRA